MGPRGRGASIGCDAPTPHVLIVGVSTRAIVVSALRAGYRVTSLDAYADLDQPAEARVESVPDELGYRWTPTGAARLACRIPSDAVVFASNLDNAPSAVAMVARGRQLWGNAPQVLRQLLDPRRVRDHFRDHGVPTPDVWVPGRPDGVVEARQRTARWMVKPMRSGGGRGIGRWDGGPVARTSYLQAFVEGSPGSVVFVAGGGRAVPVAVTRQLHGETTLGTTGFRYCGSIVCAEDMADPRLRRQAVVLAEAVGRLGLVGVGSVDFVLRRGIMHPIEVNPRWTASMELVERACGWPAFAAHVAACRGLAWPDVQWTPRAPAAYGKAIVFARRSQTVGDTRPWLMDPDVRDVPRPGTRLQAGQPVCTVFASAAGPEACRAALVGRARQVYGRLERWAKEAA